MGNYYPLLVDLSKIKCLIIGGGDVAYRKTLSLLEGDADITLISPQAVNPILQLAESGKINFLQRKYQKGDVRGVRLVYIAVDDRSVSEEISREAREEGVLLNIADNPSQGNFIVPSKIQRGDLYLAFSTGGNSPLLAKKIRQDLEKIYGPEYEDFLHLLGRERDWALAQITNINHRKAYFQELVYSDLLHLIKAGKKEEIKQKIKVIREKILSQETGGKENGA